MTKLYREFRRQVGWYVALGFLPACMATGCGTNDSGFSEPGSTGGQTSIAATTLPATGSTGGQASVAQATGGSAPQAETGGSSPVVLATGGEGAVLATGGQAPMATGGQVPVLGTGGAASAGTGGNLGTGGGFPPMCSATITTGCQIDTSAGYIYQDPNTGVCRNGAVCCGWLATHSGTSSLMHACFLPADCVTRNGYQSGGLPCL